jgi:hypothetical protein
VTTSSGTLLIWDVLCAWWLMRGIMRLTGSTATFMFASENLWTWMEVAFFACGLLYSSGLTIVKLTSHRRGNELA